MTNLHDAGPGSLRQALIDTPSGGTVDFQPGLSGTITLTSGELLIGKDVTVSGPGAGVITVSGGNQSRVFEVTAAATISGLTIADGDGNALFLTGHGGGVLNVGTLSLDGCTVSGNSATDGGGVWNSGSLSVTNSVISHNSATDGGGIAGEHGQVSVTGSHIDANAATNGGGIEYEFGMVSVTASTIDGNFATNGAGGVLNESSKLIVLDSSISGNSATGGGGAIANGPDSTVTITGSLLRGNSVVMPDGAVGGAIASSGFVTILDSTLADNTARSRNIACGGAVYNISGRLYVSDSTFSGNSAVGDNVNACGGAIYIADNNRSIAIVRSTIDGNTSRSGGGLFVESGGFGGDTGPVDVIASTISNNTATFDGGGIMNLNESLTVLNCTISGNTAVYGGGIDNAGSVNLFNATVSNNTATGDGGGFLNQTFVMPILVDRYSFGHPYVIEVTLDRPTSVTNTIIAGNHGPASSPDVQGHLTSLGHNLIGDGTGSSGLNAPGDQVGSAAGPIDPLLGPLQVNGGPTRTMALLPGSPAIDAGDNVGAPATDQRGFSRLIDPIVDIGAFELQSPWSYPVGPGGGPSPAEGTSAISSVLPFPFVIETAPASLPNGGILTGPSLPGGGSLLLSAFGPLVPVGLPSTPLPWGGRDEFAARQATFELHGVPDVAVVAAGETYRFTAWAGFGGRPSTGLTFSLGPVWGVDFPDGAAIDPETGVFTWTPTPSQVPGVYALRVCVSDGTNTAERLLTIRVPRAALGAAWDVPPDVSAILGTGEGLAARVADQVTAAVTTRDTDHGGPAALDSQGWAGDVLGGLLGSAVLAEQGRASDRRRANARPCRRNG